jgi:type IV pilus assembly protein PilO
MGALFDRILGLRPIGKVGLLLGALALVAGGYWYFWYSDMQDESAQLDGVILKAQDERSAYTARQKEYKAFRNEVAQLLDEQKELLRVLPKRDDIEQFIESVNAQVELSGLQKVSSVREPAVPEEMYLRIPIRMSLTGTYHQINRFFKNVGALKRIVTIADLKLAPPASQGGGAGNQANAVADGTLKADFVAQTFQFVDKPVRPAAGAAAAAAANAGGAR